MTRLKRRQADDQDLESGAPESASPVGVTSIEPTQHGAVPSHGMQHASSMGAGRHVTDTEGPTQPHAAQLAKQGHKHRGHKKVPDSQPGALGDSDPEPQAALAVPEATAHPSHKKQRRHGQMEHVGGVGAGVAAQTSSPRARRQQQQEPQAQLPPSVHVCQPPQHAADAGLQTSNWQAGGQRGAPHAPGAATDGGAAAAPGGGGAARGGDVRARRASARKVSYKGMDIEGISEHSSSDFDAVAAAAEAEDMSDEALEASDTQAGPSGNEEEGDRGRRASGGRAGPSGRGGGTEGSTGRGRGRGRGRGTRSRLLQGTRIAHGDSYWSVHVDVNLMQWGATGEGGEAGPGAGTRAWVIMEDMGMEADGEEEGGRVRKRRGRTGGRPGAWRPGAGPTRVRQRDMRTSLIAAINAAYAGEAGQGQAGSTRTGKRARRDTPLSGPAAQPQAQPQKDLTTLTSSVPTATQLADLSTMQLREHALQLGITHVRVSGVTRPPPRPRKGSTEQQDKPEGEAAQVNAVRGRSRRQHVLGPRKSDFTNEEEFKAARRVFEAASHVRRKEANQGRTKQAALAAHKVRNAAFLKARRVSVYQAAAVARRGQGQRTQTDEGAWGGGAFSLRPATQLSLPQLQYYLPLTKAGMRAGAAYRTGSYHPQPYTAMWRPKQATKLLQRLGISHAAADPGASQQGALAPEAQSMRAAAINTRRSVTGGEPEQEAAVAALLVPVRMAYPVGALRMLRGGCLGPGAPGGEPTAALVPSKPRRTRTAGGVDVLLPGESHVRFPSTGMFGRGPNKGQTKNSKGEGKRAGRGHEQDGDEGDNDEDEEENEEEEEEEDGKHEDNTLDNGTTAEKQASGEAAQGKQWSGRHFPTWEARLPSYLLFPPRADGYPHPGVPMPLVPPPTHTTGSCLISTARTPEAAARGIDLALLALGGAGSTAGSTDSTTGVLLNHRAPHAYMAHERSTRRGAELQQYLAVLRHAGPTLTQPSAEPSSHHRAAARNEVAADGIPEVSSSSDDDSAPILAAAAHTTAAQPHGTASLLAPCSGAHALVPAPLRVHPACHAAPWALPKFGCGACAVCVDASAAREPCLRVGLLNGDVAARCDLGVRAVADGLLSAEASGSSNISRQSQLLLLRDQQLAVDQRAHIHAQLLQLRWRDTLAPAAAAAMAASRNLGSAALANGGAELGSDAATAPALGVAVSEVAGLSGDVSSLVAQLGGGEEGLASAAGRVIPAELAGLEHLEILAAVAVASGTPGVLPASEPRIVHCMWCTGSDHSIRTCPLWLLQQLPPPSAPTSTAAAVAAADAAAMQAGPGTSMAGAAAAVAAHGGVVAPAVVSCDTQVTRTLLGTTAAGGQASTGVVLKSRAWRPPGAPASLLTLKSQPIGAGANRWSCRLAGSTLTGEGASAALDSHALAHHAALAPRWLSSLSSESPELVSAVGAISELAAACAGPSVSWEEAVGGLAKSSTTTGCQALGVGGNTLSLEMCLALAVLGEEVASASVAASTGRRRAQSM